MAWMYIQFPKRRLHKIYLTMDSVLTFPIMTMNQLQLLSLEWSYI
jgi:hypothetical protein